MLTRRDIFGKLLGAAAAVAAVPLAKAAGLFTKAKKPVETLGYFSTGAAYGNWMPYSSTATFSNANTIHMKCSGALYALTPEDKAWLDDRDIVALERAEEDFRLGKDVAGDAVRAGQAT